MIFFKRGVIKNFEPWSFIAKKKVLLKIEELIDKKHPIKISKKKIKKVTLAR